MPDRSPAARVAAAAALLLLLAILPVPAARSQPGIANIASDAGPEAPAFIDSAGRRVVLPVSIDRVLPADRNAAVLVYVLAPDKLVGPAWRRRGVSSVDRDWLATPAAMAEAARQAGADLIIDAGPVTPERAAFADQVQRLAGVPYLLIDDSFARMPRMLQAVGAILGVEQRADDLSRYADHAMSRLRGRLLIVPADSRPRVYFALGADGLTTALPGSPADAALEEVGVINVAGALGRRGTEVTVSPGQLLAWNPGIIIAARRSAYDDLRRDPQWRSLAAARDGQIYLEPSYPYGWIADPSGINRLIGINWLSTLFYPAGTQKDMQADVCNFYDKFYRIKMTNAAITALLQPAGVREEEQQEKEPLMGLSGAPPVPVPSAAPARSAPAGGRGATAALSPSALTGVPGLPNTAPNAICTIPTAPAPLPLPGLAAVPDVMNGAAAPRVSPQSREPPGD